MVEKERKDKRREGENEIGRGKSGQVAKNEEAKVDRWHAGSLADALLLDSKDINLEKLVKFVGIAELEKYCILSFGSLLLKDNSRNYITFYLN